jgi:hypothetical protein
LQPAGIVMHSRACQRACIPSTTHSTRAPAVQPHRATADDKQDLEGLARGSLEARAKGSMHQVRLAAAHHGVVRAAQRDREPWRVVVHRVLDLILPLRRRHSVYMNIRRI